MIVLARVSHVADGLSPEVNVRLQLAGRALTTVKE